MSVDKCALRRFSDAVKAAFDELDLASTLIEDSSLVSGALSLRRAADLFDGAQAIKNAHFGGDPRRVVKVRKAVRG